MATRPLFVPKRSGPTLVESVPIDFFWHAGMAPTQKKKNVVSLHEAARRRGYSRVLEISSKSNDEVGRRLSAFSLRIVIGERTYPLESAYQASKVFRGGGPFLDILELSPREAKQDTRLRSSGDLICFKFDSKKYPLIPPTAFYDWLYFKALFSHREWISRNIEFEAYSDI